jgi:23S rRNA pseudouridine1911/1915/1917 synthase
MNARLAGKTSHLRVPSEAEGERLDRFLVAHLSGTTRAALGRWIREGRVLVDGQSASKPGLALKPGMKIRVEAPPPVPDTLEPEQVAFDVVHEDDDLLVVDKPAGLTVHPGHGRHVGTLVNGLVGRGIRLSTVGAPDRPGIVHRLDRDTSGLLVVAKTDSAHHALARAFAEREIEKRYCALVWGHPRPEEGVIEREIGRSRANPTKMTVRTARGRKRSAVTQYRTVESIPGFALLSIDLRTGRTHQIRVHLESIHHSIVGDERYGGRAWRGVQDPLKRKALREFDRLALHAGELAFRHPSRDRRLRFRAPLPAEFEALLTVLRENA